ncbi:MAG: hypothetical protein ACYCOU_19295, partial [Sulfobacillus sp.]
ILERQFISRVIDSQRAQPVVQANPQVFASLADMPTVIEFTTIITRTRSSQTRDEPVRFFTKTRGFSAA